MKLALACYFPLVDIVLRIYRVILPRLRIPLQTTDQALDNEVNL
jgi:hypothetical protein